MSKPKSIQLILVDILHDLIYFSFITVVETSHDVLIGEQLIFTYSTANVQGPINTISQSCDNGSRKITTYVQSHSSRAPLTGPLQGLK